MDQLQHCIFSAAFFVVVVVVVQWFPFIPMSNLSMCWVLRQPRRGRTYRKGTGKSHVNGQQVACFTIFNYELGTCPLRTAHKNAEEIKVKIVLHKSQSAHE